MHFPTIRERFLKFWVLQLAGWSVYLVFELLFIFRMRGFGDPMIVVAACVTVALGFGSSALMRPVYRRVRYRSHSLLALFGIVFGTSYVAANIWYFSDKLSDYLLLPVKYHLPIPALNMFFYEIFYTHLLLLGWSTFYFMVKIWYDWEAQREEADRALSRAQAAQLQMLRYQLNPHFLFNSLSSIRTLVDENEEHAKEMITDLAEFLRYSLVTRNDFFITLDAELEAVRHYVAIEKKRFEQNLEVSYDIGPRAGQFPVFSFLIHPLVENAIKYGVRTSPKPLRVTITARLVDGTLHVDVVNTGVWIPPVREGSHSDEGTGTGLENIRRRLEQAMPQRYKLEVEEKDGSVRVHLELQKMQEPADVTGSGVKA